MVVWHVYLRPIDKQPSFRSCKLDVGQWRAATGGRAVAVAQVVLGRLAFISAILLSGCGIPRDASHTLERARGGILHVGVVANDPWVIDRGSTVDGIEARLVDDVASSIGARIEWVRAPEFELIRSLHERNLQLVIGGFDREVRWAADVALTRPYLETEDGKAHVLAAPPGENAWLMLLDRHVEAFKPSVSIAGAGAER